MTFSRDWVEEEDTEGSRSCFLLNGNATLDSNLGFEAAVFDDTDEGDPLLSYGGCATASSSSPSSGEEVANRLLGRRASGEADAVRFGGNGEDDDITRECRVLDPISRQPASEREGQPWVGAFSPLSGRVVEELCLCKPSLRIWQEVRMWERISVCRKVTPFMSIDPFFGCFKISEELRWPP